MATAGRQELQQSGKLVAINKKILEIKKKIQLTEGRRKALFEESETEKNRNTEEISKLKKEVVEHVVKLREEKSLSAKSRIQCARLEEAIGYLGEKTCDEVREILDLRIIDKVKKLDLLKYQVKMKEEKLKQLADKYQTLVSGKMSNYIKQKIETPLTMKIHELQNNIHAVQVQWREAEHVRIRYRDIRHALLEDAARFESTVEDWKRQIREQELDIERLQQVNTEANRLRSIARNILLQEERGAVKSATSREKQATEGKRLIIERRQELEKLEKKIFQPGKTTVRPDTEGDDSNLQTPTPPEQKDDLERNFDTLKEATGGNTIDEVLERFTAQKETTSRLSQLRISGEEQKISLEKKFDNLTALLESLKFAEVREAEESAEGLEILKANIQKQNENIQQHFEAAQKNDEIVKMIFERIQAILFSIDPIVDTEKDPLIVLDEFRLQLENLMKEYDKVISERKSVVLEEAEEKITLPTPYINLVRKTPLPPQGPSVTPDKASDEEEEVPSRGYLKRQAQVVFDAKSRRKSLRFSMKR